MEYETVVLRFRQRALQATRAEPEMLDPKSYPIPSPTPEQRDKAALCYADFLLCVVLNPGDVAGCRVEYCACFDAIFAS